MSPGAVVVRDATPGDVAAITALQNERLLDTTIDWGDRLHTEAEKRTWLDRQRDAGHAVLVAEVGGAVVGWAAFGDYRDTDRWAGYWPCVEHTIYVDHHRHGTGIGRALMTALADRARAAGKRVMIGAVDGDNESSIEFHLRLGFREVGRLPGIGEKLGRRLDLVLLQLDL